MLGRRRSGTRVADAHPVVKAIFEGSKSRRPRSRVGKAIRLCPQTSKGLLSWRLWGMHTSSPEFCRPRQRSTVLFRRILAVQDLQCALLLLLGQLFPSGGATCFDNVWNCTRELLVVEGTVRVRQLLSLPLAFGGLGLWSAVLSQTAEKGISALRTLSGSPCFEAGFQKAAIFRLQQPAGNGLWDVGGQRPGRSPENRDPTEPRFGWQCLASADVERTFLQGVVWPELSPADRALLRSQRGPFAGIPFTCSHSGGRHLWCSLPLSAHFCRCGRPLDVRGHHRSACGRAGVLGTTGILRLWQTDFLCSMAHDSQWTQPWWCLPVRGMGVLVTSVLTTMEQLCSKHGARRWPAHGAAERVWWCWVSK